MPRRPSHQPARGRSENLPESSRTNPASNTPGQSRPSYPEQGLAPEHPWRSLEEFDALVKQHERTGISTYVDLSYGSSRGKKLVRHQRLDVSLADLLFKWEGLVRTKREGLLHTKG